MEVNPKGCRCPSEICIHYSESEGEIPSDKFWEIASQLMVEKFPGNKRVVDFKKYFWKSSDTENRVIFLHRNKVV